MAGYLPNIGDSVLIKVKTGQELADACLIPNSVIYLDPSITYTVPYTIDIEDKITINGNGATVTIGNNDIIFNCINSVKLSFNNIHFLAFSNAFDVANGLTPTEEADGTLFIVSATAIEAKNVKEFNVSDCRFFGFRGGAVRCGGVSIASNFNRLNKIYDCTFMGCAVGIVTHEDAEYGNITNCNFNACGWGIINNAGSWVLENIKSNYSANGIWNVTEDTYVSNATANFLHGAMANLQLNHSNPGSVVFNENVEMQVGATNYKNYGLFHKGAFIPSLSNLVMYFGSIFYESGDRPWNIIGGTLQNVAITTELISNIVLQNVDLRQGNDLGNATTGETNPSRFNAYMPTATPYTTPQLAANTPTKLVVPLTPKTEKDFSFDIPNLRQYFDAPGVTDRWFIVHSSATVTVSAPNQTVTVETYVNGVIVEGVGIDRFMASAADVGSLISIGTLSLSHLDYVEIFVTLTTAGTITFKRLSVTLNEIVGVV